MAFFRFFLLKVSELEPRLWAVPLLFNRAHSHPEELGIMAATTPAAFNRLQLSSQATDYKSSDSRYQGVVERTAPALELPTPTLN